MLVNVRTGRRTMIIQTETTAKITYNLPKKYIRILG
jgi:hypothetical protein